MFLPATEFFGTTTTDQPWPNDVTCRKREAKKNFSAAGLCSACSKQFRSTRCASRSEEGRRATRSGTVVPVIKKAGWMGAPRIGPVAARSRAGHPFFFCCCMFPLPRCDVHATRRDATRRGTDATRRSRRRSRRREHWRPWTESSARGHVDVGFASRCVACRAT